MLSSFPCQEIRTAGAFSFEEESHEEDKLTSTIHCENFALRKNVETILNQVAYCVTSYFYRMESFFAKDVKLK